VRSNGINVVIIPRLLNQAIISQTLSKYEANIRIKHSLHEANIKQTSSWLFQLTYSQLVEPA